MRNKPNAAQVAGNNAFYTSSNLDAKAKSDLAKIRASGQTDAELRAMIDQAVAEGRVKVIPPVYMGG